jgi:hypothetical protein
LTYADPPARPSHEIKRNTMQIALFSPSELEMNPVADSSDVSTSSTSWNSVGRGRSAMGRGGRCRMESEERLMKTKVW